MAINAAAAIDAAKALADRRSDASITDPDWVRYVGWGIESLYRLIVSLDPGAYFTQYDFALVGGPSFSAFPLSVIGGTGVRAVHGLDVYPDTNARRTVGRRNFRERNAGRIGGWVPTMLAADRRYDMRGAVLWVTPYEAAAGTYRLYYRTAPYKYTSAADTNSMDPQCEAYDEWVAIRAACKALKIEGTDANPWREELELLRESIIGEHTRDDGEAATIADVEDDGSYVP